MRRHVCKLGYSDAHNPQAEQLILLYLLHNLFTSSAPKLVNWEHRSLATAGGQNEGWAMWWSRT